MASNFVPGRARPSMYKMSTPRDSRSLRPNLGDGASQRARVGWVRTLAILNILETAR